MRDEYPASDYPWTFYFQGVVMPKWATCWHFIDVPTSDRDWYLDRVCTRIDHVGVVESEDADIFLIAAQQLLLQGIAQKGKIIQNLKSRNEDGEEIYSDIISGLQQMILISDNEEAIFWTSGYPEDGEALTEAVRRFRLGKEHPDYSPPPHRATQHRERLFELNYQRKELRRMLDDLGSDKALKRFIHELKDKKAI